SLVRRPDGQAILITKGAPESVLARCPTAPAGAKAVLDGLFGGGARVIAVATRPWSGGPQCALDDERDLQLDGCVTFVDAPKDVGYLGDGVNDAVALRDADVGISVDTGSDVAKDAADIVMLGKDLAILASGVLEGRRIFSNTMKYVLMGTSSNFGNMFSAAAGSVLLNFLPMTPTQILLNNLLYDTGEMTIPTDKVDLELLERPAQWDIRLIRRFMMFFGPISSLFDFMTFAVMLFVFKAHGSLFQTAWFTESLATQSLVIFAIRTRRVPFFRSRPGLLLSAGTIAVVGVGLLLPYSPIASWFGFSPLPAAFLGILAAMVVIYLFLV